VQTSVQSNLGTAAAASTALTGGGQNVVVSGSPTITACPAGTCPSQGIGGDGGGGGLGAGAAAGIAIGVILLVGGALALVMWQRRRKGPSTLATAAISMRFSKAPKGEPTKAEQQKPLQQHGPLSASSPGRKRMPSKGPLKHGGSSVRSEQSLALSSENSQMSGLI
jgi:hypothetical protein